ncbi:hypothetical protein ACGFWF_29175 [Streptomyces sp. NPDC048581]
MPFWEVHLARPSAGLPRGATEQDFMMSAARGAPPKEALVQAVLPVAVS